MPNKLKERLKVTKEKFAEKAKKFAEKAKKFTTCLVMTVFDKCLLLSTTCFAKNDFDFY